MKRVGVTRQSKWESVFVHYSRCPMRAHVHAQCRKTVGICICQTVTSPGFMLAAQNDESVVPVQTLTNYSHNAASHLSIYNKSGWMVQISSRLTPFECVDTNQD